MLKKIQNPKVKTVNRNAILEVRSFIKVWNEHGTIEAISGLKDGVSNILKKHGRMPNVFLNYDSGSIMVNTENTGYEWPIKCMKK